MTFQEFRTALLVTFLTIVFTSCQTSPNATFQIISLDTSIKVTKISISDLVKNHKAYHGQYIETTGRFYQAFEEFAIYPDKNNLTSEADGFWLGTNKELNIDDAAFKKMNGKRVTIKGEIDTAHKGHLSSYLGTIDEIYFWQH